MANINLNDVPDEMYVQLVHEAAVNYRSVEQEIMRRIERTLQIDAALRCGRGKSWAGESPDAGPAAPLKKEDIEAIRDRILKGRKLT
jgi:hypothetical protein